MGPYLVTVGDCAGPIAEYRFRTFTDAKRLVEVVRRCYSGKRAAFVCNLDRMDVDNDGLTEEERDLL